jgi:hypothetical protein
MGLRPMRDMITPPCRRHDHHIASQTRLYGNSLRS